MIKALSDKCSSSQSRLIALEMPLADHAGVVAGRLQRFGDRPLAAVEAIKHRDAIDVAVFTGENRRPLARRWN